MRRSEKAVTDYDFPGRDYLDETRFKGGRDRICNLKCASHSSPQEAKA